MKKQVSLCLDSNLIEKVKVLAIADSRNLNNYIGVVLANLVGDILSPGKPMEQINLETLLDDDGVKELEKLQNDGV